jgi:hypothetical protein
MAAGAAGGAVFRVQAGNGDSAFERVLRENSAHYLLSVEVIPADRDGAAHAIRVRVNKRGTTVRSRATVIVPRAGVALGRAVTAQSWGPETPNFNLEDRESRALRANT